MLNVTLSRNKSLVYHIFCRVKDRTRTQLQRLASFLQATQPFFQQLQPEVIRDVKTLILCLLNRMPSYVNVCFASGIMMAAEAMSDR